MHNRELRPRAPPSPHFLSFIEGIHHPQHCGNRWVDLQQWGEDRLIKGTGGILDGFIEPLPGLFGLLRLQGLAIGRNGVGQLRRQVSHKPRWCERFLLLTGAEMMRRHGKASGLRCQQLGKKGRLAHAIIRADQ